MALQFISWGQRREERVTSPKRPFHIEIEELRATEQGEPYVEITFSSKGWVVFWYCLEFKEKIRLSVV